VPEACITATQLSGRTCQILLELVLEADELLAPGQGSACHCSILLPADLEDSWFCKKAQAPVKECGSQECRVLWPTQKQSVHSCGRHAVQKELARAASLCL
jgi:hypothetical protein